MLRLVASRGLRSATRGAVLQQSRRCLVTKFSKVRTHALHGWPLPPALLWFTLSAAMMGAPAPQKISYRLTGSSSCLIARSRTDGRHCRSSTIFFSAAARPQLSTMPQIWHRLTETSCLPDRALTQDHEWIKVEGDIGTIGITDHAQNALGDVVFVDLPEVGSEVEKDETMGAVESVKAASDIYSPVSGEVVEVNEVLPDEPALVNTAAEVHARRARAHAPRHVVRPPARRTSSPR